MSVYQDAGLIRNSLQNLSIYKSQSWRKLQLQNTPSLFNFKAIDDAIIYFRKGSMYKLDKQIWSA